MRAFISDQSGAVSVPWITLTAGLVSIALSAVHLVQQASTGTGQQMADILQGPRIAPTFAEQRAATAALNPPETTEED